MSKDDTFCVLRKAFEMWSNACNSAVFEEKRDGNANIVIKFVDKKHRCPFRGDGKGESIGHAHYPYANRGLAGDIHFDNDEKFTLQSTTNTNSINFLWAASHEIGRKIFFNYILWSKVVVRIKISEE